MRRFGYSLIFCLMAVSLLAAVFVPAAKESREASAAEGALTCLVAGFDDAAANTDVLMLVRLDPESTGITVLQLPRDTYFHTEGYAGKLNGLYPTYLARGMSREEALGALCDELSRCFGITVDRFAAVGTEAFAALVDALGGVSVSLPAPIGYREGDTYHEIPAGEQLLGGKEALRFIRFRSAYVEGDLGRMDAQKLLLMAIYRKAKSELTLPAMLTLVPKVYPSLVTDMPLSEGIAYAKTVLREREGLRARLLTLPGEATYGEEDGRWYYVANHPSAAEVMSLYFGAKEPFDAHGALLDEARLSFKNIYHDKNCSYTVYTEDTIGDLDVKTKQK